ncbi:mechanosensitive ion channel domain-containing protein [Desulfocastanea catecholica]
MGLENLLEKLTSFVPLIITAFVVGVILWITYWLLIKRHPNLGNERLFPRQLIMLGLTLLGLLISVFFLPISDSSRNQLMGLIGILLSGIFAFSSTTVISNLMAGVLLRITKPFRVGDFIRIGEHFGRVSERGLFDTEIQTETRELIALPNTYCISNPVTTIRSSGTIISTSLSLGYDLDHRRIESLLMEAARACGLSEPFVHILELGNFSVSYRVSGLLEEPKRLISARSNLYACVLDTLHSHDIEIMSPSFMNQRKISDSARIIPSNTVVTISKAPESSAEDIAFDKAEKAEKLENEKLQVMQEIEKLEGTLKKITNEEEKKVKQEALDKMQERLKSLKELPKQSEIENSNAEQDAALDGDSVALHPHQ